MSRSWLLTQTGHWRLQTHVFLPYRVIRQSGKYLSEAGLSLFICIAWPRTNINSWHASTRSRQNLILQQLSLAVAPSARGSRQS